MKRIYLLIGMLVLAFGLTACQTFEAKTPREAVAACYYTVRTVYNTGADMEARGKLPADQKAKLLATGDQALVACDAARAALGAGDYTTAEGQLKIAEVLLLQ